MMIDKLTGKSMYVLKSIVCMFDYICAVAQDNNWFKKIVFKNY